MISENGFYALKIGYFGEGFFGSQVQPNFPTVASVMREALFRAGTISPGTLEKIAFASRTDRGVSAIGNVCKYYGKRPILGRINKFLPETVCAWGYSPVPEDFSERRDASLKKYSYFLPDTGENLSIMRQVCRMYSSKSASSFRAFSKRDKVDRGPGAPLAFAKVSKEGSFFVFRFAGKAFLWNQVRKMVGAASGAAKGKIGLSLIEECLSGSFAGRDAGIPTSPPEGLLLESIEYPKISFIEEPKKIQERFSKTAFSALQKSRVLLGLASEGFGH